MAGSANLIVDLGNGTVKFKSRDRNGKFKSTIERTDELNEIKNTVVYDNKAYVLGYGGNYDREYNKVKKENWIYQLLLALNLGTTSQDINVCLLLLVRQKLIVVPIIWRLVAMKMTIQMKKIKVMILPLICQILCR